MGVEPTLCDRAYSPRMHVQECIPFRVFAHSHSLPCAQVPSSAFATRLPGRKAREVSRRAHFRNQGMPPPLSPAPDIHETSLSKPQRHIASIARAFHPPLSDWMLPAHLHMPCPYWNMLPTHFTPAVFSGWHHLIDLTVGMTRKRINAPVVGSRAQQLYVGSS